MTEKSRNLKDFGTFIYFLREVAIYQQIEKQDLYRRKENPQRRS